MSSKNKINLLNNMAEYPAKIGSFVKDKKQYTSAKIWEILNEYSNLVLMANAFVDWLPVIWLAKNTPIFLKSLKSNEWRTEIFRFSAVLWCTPFELMAIYSGFVSHDLWWSTSFYTMSKFVYRSMYMIYICKTKNVSLSQISKKMTHGLELNARIYAAFMMDALDDTCNHNENISKIRSNIQNFPKNFNLKKNQ